MQTESKNIKETLAPLLRVLSDLGGKFTFTDDEGQEFVIAGKEVFEEETQRPVPEQQLSLPQADRVADAIRKNIDIEIQDDVIDRINKDIAMSRAQESIDENDDIDDLAGIIVSDDGIEEDVTVFMHPSTPLRVNPTPPPIPQIRFESVRGDLNPHLQD